MGGVIALRSAFLHDDGGQDVHFVRKEPLRRTLECAYDNMNRLTIGTATAGVDYGLTLSWTYSRHGNRWAQNANGSGKASAVHRLL